MTEGEPPRITEVAVGDPLLEHSLESPLEVLGPRLEAAPRTATSTPPPVLLPDMVVVTDESLQLLAQ